MEGGAISFIWNSPLKSICDIDLNDKIFYLLTLKRL